MVFVSTVLHHIPPAEHGAWINGLYAIMNSGDYLVIFEHNMKNPVTARVVGRSNVDKREWMLAGGYCKQLVKNSFCEVAATGRAAGDNVKLRYTYFSPWRNGLFTALERLFWFIPFGAQYCVYAKKM